jgi:hypothetical protein
MGMMNTNKQSKKKLPHLMQLYSFKDVCFFNSHRLCICHTFVHDVSMLKTTKGLTICVGTIVHALVFLYLTPSNHTCMHLSGRDPCYLLINLTPNETLLPRLKRGLLELLGWLGGSPLWTCEHWRNQFCEINRVRLNHPNSSINCECGLHM